MRCKPNKKGFTLVELMVVISIIVVLITMFILGIPAVMRMVKEAETTSKLKKLKTQITQCGHDLPDDSEMNTNGTTVRDVDNSLFLESLQEHISGVKEDELMDAWGHAIMYDRLWEKNEEIVEGDEDDYEDDDEDEEYPEEDEDKYAMLRIDALLPGHPVIKRCNEEADWEYTPDELMEEDNEIREEFEKYEYVLWSLGEKIYLDDDAEESAQADDNYFYEDDFIEWGLRGGN